jgi:hypothetical protein
MSDLRNKIIRLAHANPELRPHLLPLLKEGTQEKSALREMSLDEIEAVLQKEHRVMVESINRAENAVAAMSQAVITNPMAKEKVLPVLNAISRGLMEANQHTNMVGHFARHLTSYDR